MLEQWLHGQLKELYGMPIYWIDRTAKLLQFTSGLVIIAQIIGEERLDRFAETIRADINRVVEFAPAKRVVKNSFLYFWYFLKGIFFHEGKDVHYWQDKQKEVSGELTFFSDLLLAIVGSICSPILLLIFSPFKSWLITIIAALFSIPVGLAVGFIAGAIILPIVLSILAAIILYPLEFVVDRFMKIVGMFLGVSPLSRTVLYLSLLLFVIGMLLDFIAS